MEELHVGSIVHHFLFSPADDLLDPTAKDFYVCEAAVVTKIRDREQGKVSLYILSEGSMPQEALNMSHGMEDGTWHWISECPNHS